MSVEKYYGSTLLCTHWGENVITWKIAWQQCHEERGFPPQLNHHHQLPDAKGLQCWTCRVQESTQPSLVWLVGSMPKADRDTVWLLNILGRIKNLCRLLSPAKVITLNLSLENWMEIFYCSDVRGCKGWETVQKQETPLLLGKQWTPNTKKNNKKLTSIWGCLVRWLKKAVVHFSQLTSCAPPPSHSCCRQEIQRVVI